MLSPPTLLSLLAARVRLAAPLAGPPVRLVTELAAKLRCRGSGAGTMPTAAGGRLGSTRRAARETVNEA
jgi:hypothetical protein